MTWTVIRGDSRDWVRRLPAGVFDACVTDPPYEVNMDGSLSRAATAERGRQTWDGTGVAHDVELWRGVRRLVRPGGFALAFSATRTLHRLTFAFEEAGWEVKNLVAWLYGQSFPGVNRLRPAMEPILVARNGPRGSLPGLPARNVVATDELDGVPPFLYCHKASPAERDAGCQGLEPCHAPVMNVPRLTRGKLNGHASVKPVGIMRWLVALAAAPGGVVLDPFTGSGTTGMACAYEGVDFVGIELDERHCDVARRRIAWAEEDHGRQGQ